MYFHYKDVFMKNKCDIIFAMLIFCTISNGYNLTAAEKSSKPLNNSLHQSNNNHHQKTNKPTDSQKQEQYNDFMKKRTAYAQHSIPGFHYG